MELTSTDRLSPPSVAARRRLRASRAAALAPGADRERRGCLDRTVIQWDKDDLEALGLLKVDVLALGMLTAIARLLPCADRGAKTGRDVRMRRAFRPKTRRPTT
jgi:hypothetical protein